MSLGASILLMDEKKGSQAAGDHGFVVVGVLGVLVSAARRGFVDFDQAVTRLIQKTNFRISETVIQSARESVRAALQ